MDQILFEENFKNYVAAPNLKLALLLATAMYSQWTHESAAKISSKIVVRTSVLHGVKSNGACC
jgi:hypothetical protein